MSGKKKTVKAAIPSKVFLVQYIGDPESSIETVLLSQSHFNSWLKEHNSIRKQKGDLPEDREDFSVTPVNIFVPKKDEKK